MSEPEIYFYRNGNVSKIAAMPSKPFDAEYLRFYKGRTIESVERRRKGRSRQTFSPHGPKYFGDITQGQEHVPLIPYNDKREDDGILKGLLKGLEAATLLNRHGNGRRILVRDKLKR